MSMWEIPELRRPRTPADYGKYLNFDALEHLPTMGNT